MIGFVAFTADIEACRRRPRGRLVCSLQVPRNILSMRQIPAALRCTQALTYSTVSSLDRRGVAMSINLAHPQYPTEPRVEIRSFPRRFRIKVEYQKRNETQINTLIKVQPAKSSWGLRDYWTCCQCLLSIVLFPRDKILISRVLVCRLIR